MDGPIVPTTSVSGKNRKIAQIIDGTSNTLLVGEKYLSRQVLGGQFDCNDDQGYTDAWDNDMIVFAMGDANWGLANPSMPPQPIRPDVQSGTCGGMFGSIHTGVCLFTLCDASVRGVSFSVNNQAFLYMCKIDDSQPFQWDP